MAAARVPMTVANKFVERLLSALTTIVWILTGIGSIFAFVNSGKAEPIVSIAIAVLVIICANLALSIGSFIWKSLHLGALTNLKTWWLSGGFLASIFCDVFALLYALGTFSQTSSTMFIMIGILLAIDFLIDGFIHFTR